VEASIFSVLTGVFLDLKVERQADKTANKTRKKKKRKVCSIGIKNAAIQLEAYMSSQCY
jgi:hypothetical protein